MIGTCRGPEDEEIVKNLKIKAKEMNIIDKIEFKINVSRDELYSLFQDTKVAIHTMKYEHFGIAVVELMSSGIITIAHNSAGPKTDIIGPSPKPIGYLADTAEEYAFFVSKSLKGYDS